jgi:hypothetical protein
LSVVKTPTECTYNIMYYYIEVVYIIDHMYQNTTPTTSYFC